MTNKERFDETVDILVKAYLNDTLQHGHCAACAVGNIIAKKNDYKIQVKVGSFSNDFMWQSRAGDNKGHHVSPEWNQVFVTLTQAMFAPTDKSDQARPIDGIQARPIDGIRIWEIFLDKVYQVSQAHQPKVNPELYTGAAKAQIDSTGYTWQELARIETAFETADCPPYYTQKETWGWAVDKDSQNAAFEAWMYNGLMAVVEVLADIHQLDFQEVEAAKELFVKA